MTVTNTVYTLNAYTVDTDTDLVPAAPNFTMASLLVVNTTGSVANVSVTLTDETDTALAVLMPGHSFSAGETKTLDIRSLNAPVDHKIMVQADIAGVNFVASGVVIT